MAKPSVELTLDPDVLTLARAAASEAGVSLSRYVDEATRERLRKEGAAAMRAFWRTDDGRDLADELRKGEHQRAALFDDLDQGDGAAA